MSKFQKSAKLRKKLLKNGNSPSFEAIKAKPKFLTFNARLAFNRLQLAFTTALILQHFDLECHIWIETDVLGYAIGEILSQLIFKTSLDRVVTKTDLG